MTKTGGHLGWVSGGGGYFGEPWTDRVLTEWLLSVQVQTANDAARSLLGQAGSQLPKTPRNYSIASGLESGDGSMSSVGNAAAGQVLVSDPGLTRAPAAAAPFDGVNLSPSQTGYDPAERGNPWRATRHRSTMRSSTAASARIPAPQLTPPRLADTAPAVAEPTAAGRLGDTPAAAAPTPAPMNAETAVPGKATKGGSGLGTAATIGAAGPLSTTVVPPSPPVVTGRGSNGSMRTDVPQVSRTEAPAPPAVADRAAVGSADQAGSRETIAMPLRGAGGGARVGPGLLPSGTAPANRTGCTESTSSSDPKGASAFAFPGGTAAAWESLRLGRGAGVKSGQSGRQPGPEAQAQVAVSVAGASGGGAGTQIWDAEGSGERAGVGEAHMRAGRAVATFVRATHAQEEAVLNDAWRESVASELPSAGSGGDVAGAESVQARAEVIKSLLAHNAEALQAISKAGSGLPLDVGEGDEPQVEASPAAVPVAVASGSMGVGETGGPRGDRTPSQRQPVAAQGFFVDVDPSEYSSLHHGFDSATRSRPARSVGSQSTSSQGVWWNRP